VVERIEDNGKIQVLKTNTIETQVLSEERYHEKQNHYFIRFYDEH